MRWRLGTNLLEEMAGFFGTTVYMLGGDEDGFSVADREVVPNVVIVTSVRKLGTCEQIERGGLEYAFN